jgi:hypothetical protein
LQVWKNGFVTLNSKGKGKGNGKGKGKGKGKVVPVL